MLFNKPLVEIDESDLHVLIDDKVAERKTIEYKRDLPGNSYTDRKEFLADVSSFANTVGGYLIYGIDTEHGIPVELCGVELTSIDDFKLACENRLRDGLFPQIPPFDIHAIEHAPNNYIIILRIPRSWSIPHRVTLEGHGHFYGRNSAGHFQMDVPQLRTAFELAGTIAERIRSFRVERLSRISSGEETPAPLNELEPKIVLHLVPLNAFNTLVSLDLKPLNVSFDGKLLDKGTLLEPLSVYDGGLYVNMRFNIDGFVRSTRSEFNTTSTIGYTQVFRNGIIEIVDISILGINVLNAERYNIKIETKSFSGEVYERKILEAMKRYTDLQKFLGIELPFFIMVSFLGVKGYKIAIQKSEHHIVEFTHEIDRMNLIIPEVIVENFDSDLAEIMRPIFDTVWNAAGYTASPNYDTSGKFIFGY